MKKKTASRIDFKNLYWALPILLFLFQALFTFNSQTQIRYEELAEGIRNPFWLQNGLMYDGVSGSLAWYGLLAFVYNIFGFSLFSAKYVRLFLHLVSLLCLAALLKKYIGSKLAIVPMIAFALSPTLLYLNILQTTYGVDIPYLVICLFWLFWVYPKYPRLKNVSLVMFGFTAMIGWLSYPTFIYYLPSLTLLVLWQTSFSFRKILFSLIGFALPVILAFSYVKNKEIMIYDSVQKSGLFRGAGVLNFSLTNLVQNFKLNLTNLFSYSYGYNFELFKVEFSDYYPILSLISITLIIVIVVSKQTFLKLSNLPLISILLILIMNIFIGFFTSDSIPGMRRYTGEIVAIYGLFTLSWLYINTKKNLKKSLKQLAIFALLLIPLHHLLVYPQNLAHLKDPSYFNLNDAWFRQNSDPNLFLKSAVDSVQKQPVYLECDEISFKNRTCRYSEAYAAIAGSCLWNKLRCHDIYGYDQKTKKFIPLSVDLWNTYYLSH